MADILAAFSELDLVSFREDAVGKTVAAIDASTLNSLPQLQNIKQTLKSIACLISDIERMGIAGLSSDEIDLLIAVDGCRAILKDLRMRLGSFKRPRYFRDDVKKWEPAKPKWVEENKGFLLILKKTVDLCAAHARLALSS